MSVAALVSRVRRLRKIQAEIRARRNPPPPAEAPRIEGDASKVLTLDALIAKYKDDFLGFCELLEIVTKSGQRRALTPIKNTQRIFHEQRSGRDVVLKPRQVGITTIECARDVWFFLMHSSANVVVVVQSLTDHSPLNTVSKILRVMFEALARNGVDVGTWRTFSTNRFEIEGREATLSIVEAGASKAAAEKKGRAGVIHRLHVTEVAFFEFAQDTLNAMLECVPAKETGSEVVFESTANGAAGYFYDRYQDAAAKRDGYTAHFLRWFDNTDDYRTELEPGEVVSPKDERETAWLSSGVLPEQIKWYRLKLAEKKRQDLVDQEYPSDPDTCFIVSGDGFFDQVKTATLIGRVTTALKITPIRSNGARGEIRVWHGPLPGYEYVVAADPSEGTGGDPAAAQVYEKRTGRHMASMDGQIPPWEFARWLAKLGRSFNDAIIAVERNNHGHTVLRCLETDEKYPFIFVDRDERVGWLTNEVTRTPALDTLEEAHRNDHWSCKDLNVVKEFRTFVRNPKTRKAEAAPGAHDDHVMTAAIAWDVLTRRVQKKSAGGNLPSF